MAVKYGMNTKHVLKNNDELGKISGNKCWQLAGMAHFTEQLLSRILYASLVGCMASDQ